MNHLESTDAAGVLSWAVETFGDRFGIATSFQKEGMVIIDLAARISTRVRLFTLDTGRLPDETHRMIRDVRARYGIETEIVKPDPPEVSAMVTAHGPDLFYESVSNRMLCCEVRKVRPLERKLREFDAWASGLRRGQSETRSGVRKAEIAGGRVKLSPLADWSAAQVEDYIRAHDVPLHPLYAQGYGTIGCAPCTRAIVPGEDLRSGRWWWEQDAKKECGIHFAADGTVRRA